MSSLPADRDSEPKHARVQIAGFDRVGVAAPEARSRHPYESAAAKDEEILKLKLMLLKDRDAQVREVGSHLAQLTGLHNALSRADEARENVENLYNALLKADEARDKADQEKLVQQHQRQEQQADLVARLRLSLAERDRQLSEDLALRHGLARELALAWWNFNSSDRLVRIYDLSLRTQPNSAPFAPVSARQQMVSTFSRIRHGARIGKPFVAIERLRRELSRSPLFNAAWYRGQRPDLGNAQDPLEHFVLHGIDEGTSPNPLIDVDWIAPRTGQSQQSPLRNYLLHGRYTQLRPTPLFDVEHYRNVARLHPSADALSHYLRHGRPAGLSPHPLFDRDFYSAQLPNVVQSNIDPFVHYVVFPFEFDPHPLFSNEFYMHQHPELRGLGIPPLFHYLEFGLREKTNPHPSFSSANYLSRYQDVAAAGLNPLLHYVTFGRVEGRQIDPVN